MDQKWYREGWREARKKWYDTGAVVEPLVGGKGPMDRYLNNASRT